MEENTIKQLVDRIVEDGIITREEQNKLNQAILADNLISPEEKEQINRLMNLVVQGLIKVR